MAIGLPTNNLKVGLRRNDQNEMILYIYFVFNKLTSPQPISGLAIISLLEANDLGYSMPPWVTMGEILHNLLEVEQVHERTILKFAHEVREI